MFSFWSRGPAKDFPYDIGDLIAGHEETSIFHMHRGKKKVRGSLILLVSNEFFLLMQSTSEEVTIFRHELKAGSEDGFEKAKVALKRLKTLRHPNILTFIDALEVCTIGFH